MLETELQSKKIEHLEEMEKLFQETITGAIKSFKETKQLAPCVMLVFKKKGEDDLVVLPLPSMLALDSHMFSVIIKETVKMMKSNPPEGLELVGTIFETDAFMSQAPKEEALDKLGNFKQTKKPSEDPNAKHVLLFSMETTFKKHTLSYEYIKSNDDEEVVINAKPVMDYYSAYDSREAQSNFGCLFMEPLQNLN